MPLEFRPRARRKPTLNITSLIDVLFLLLIFFMLSSTFIEHPAIQLNLPEASAAEPVRVDTLTLSITQAGALYLNGVPTPMGALGNKLRAAVATDPELSLILKADRQVPYGVVIEAIDVAKRAGITQVTAFTHPPADAPAA